MLGVIGMEMLAFVACGSCRVWLDRRLMPGEDPHRIARELLAAVAAAGIDRDGITVTAEGTMARPGFRTPVDHPLGTTAHDAVAGLGGAFYTLVSVSAFTRDMTSGAGYIALAALIFGRWNPVGALLASLLFGFASNLQSILSFLGTPVPSQFLAMLPYVVTILAVAGLVGASRAPAASGRPYTKE